jgi:hypothetical protein
MRRDALCALACFSISIGFVGWRIHAMRIQSTPHFEIVVDPSLSHAQRCESLLGLTKRALAETHVTRSSTLTILVLGDGATASEPWQLGSYSIPATRRVLEGRAANLRRQQDLLTEIARQCDAIHATFISPIFLGVKQAVADLRAHGCTVTSQCQIFVDSDLEENVEPSIKASLSGTTSRKYRLPPLINNRGIEISFCGLAVTAGRIVDPSGREIRKALPRDPGREDRLSKTWLSLFTEPEMVRLQPYCPKFRDLGADMTFVGAAEGNQ